MNEAISLKNIVQESSDLSCPICLDVIISANSTVCGHTFCEQCILESLLLTPVFKNLSFCFNLK